MQVIVCKFITFTLKTHKKWATSRLRLWYDNALGKGWENTREAFRTRGVAFYTLPDYSSKIFQGCMRFRTIKHEANLFNFF